MADTLFWHTFMVLKAFVEHIELNVFVEVQVNPTYSVRGVAFQNKISSTLMIASTSG